MDGMVESNRGTHLTLFFLFFSKMTHLIKSNQKYTPNGECYINDFCVEKSIKIERTDKNYQYIFSGSAG